MEWLLGIVLGAVISSIIGGIMGSVSTLGSQRFIRYRARKGLAEIVETVYQEFQNACEPETLHPDYPGNPSAIKATARNSANRLLLRFQRSGFDPPPKCSVDDQSLRDWFMFVEHVRIQLG